MFHAACPKCGTFAIYGEGVDPHVALDQAGCRCCPLDHHHGQAANACEGSASTPGPQGHVVNGEQVPCTVDNPDCKVCRPLHITAMAATVQMTGVGG